MYAPFPLSQPCFILLFDRNHLYQIHLLATMDQPYPLDSSDQLQHLVSVDLQQYRGDADKLYSISVNLQTLSREQRARLDKLQENRPPSLHNSNSTSTSRRPTDELQKNNPIINDNEEGTVIVFNPSDNNLEIRQKNSMKGIG